MTPDPLLLYLREGMARDVLTAAGAMNTTVDLLTAGHATAPGAPAATELRTAIEQMTAVRDTLLDHAATLAPTPPR